MASVLLASTMAAAKPFWAAVLAMGASYIDQRLVGALSNQHIEGPRMSDLRLQSSAYGVPINKVIGTYRLPGNILWGTNFVEHKKTQSAGKGGGSKVSTYSYSVSVAIGICEGPITGITRIWADGKEVTHLFIPSEHKEKSSKELMSILLSRKGRIKSDQSKIAYTLYQGTDWQEPDPFIQGLEKQMQAPAYRDLAYIVLHDMDVTQFGNRIPNFTFEVVGYEYSVASAVRLLSRETWLIDYGDKDVTASGMYGIEAPGMVVSSVKSHRENIEQLMAYANFGASEIDGKVVFKLKGDYPVYDIDISEFGAKEGNAGEEKSYGISRKHDLELPKACTISYISKDKDYQQGTQSAVRPNSNSQNTVSAALDLVLTDAQAKALAEQKLYEHWARRAAFYGTLGPRWAFLAPGYIIRTQIAGRTREIQLTKVTAGANNVVKVEGTDIGGNTFSQATRKTDEEINQSPTQSPSRITCEFLDMSRPTTDTSSEPRLYIAATGDPYIGAAIYETKDHGASWDLKDYVPDSSIMGTTLTVLEPCEAYSWDNANKLTVKIIDGSLESRPKIDVLNGYNAAMVGNEVIQFRKAVLVAPDTYELSELLRGRLGTEDQINTHRINERFILLDSATIAPLSAPINEWYVDKHYKIVPFTKDIGDGLTTDVTFKNMARMFQPWSVCHVQGIRNVSGDLTVIWVRRDKSNTVWLDGVDMPMSETQELYEIDIVGADNVILRTFTATTPAITYTSTQQMADFADVRSAIKLRIYQISSIRGRGIEKEVVL